MEGGKKRGTYISTLLLPPEKIAHQGKKKISAA